MKMASLNSSVFISFTILTLSLALCSASRTTLFSKDVGAIEGDGHQVSLDHKVRPPPKKPESNEVGADKFGFKVRDGGDDVGATKMSNMDHKVSAFITKDENYEPEEKPPKGAGEYDVEAAKMSNMGHQVSAFDAYDPEEKQKPGKHEVEVAQMNNMDHGAVTMGHGWVRPISGSHGNHGDMMAHYRVKPIKDSSNDGDMIIGYGLVRPISGYKHRNHGDMMAHYRVKPIKGSSNDGGMNPEKGN